MHKPSLSQLVYNTLYPRPRPNDPSSFAAHIARNLVTEVRAETSNFYGALDCIEAQYPGLDYSFAPHRKRLSRFHHHRRLFRAFDELSLTDSEIATLCRWEGTKSARERYERDEGMAIRDTTMDALRPASPRIPPSVHVHSWDNENDPSRSGPNRAEESESFASGAIVPSEGHETEEESSDEGIESCGRTLNERLLEVTAAREQGADVTNDELEQFEQWIKEAIERDGYTDMMDAIREGRPIDFSYRDTPAFSNLPSPSTMSSSVQTPANTDAATRHSEASMAGSTLAPTLAPMTVPETSIGSSQHRTRGTAGDSC